MRFVAGQVAAMAELLPARTLWRSSIGKTLAAPREPVAPSGRCCFQWRSKDAIGKMLPVGEVAEKLEGRG